MSVWRTYYYLPLYYILLNQKNIYTILRGSDLMIVGFTTTYAISAYHHWSCEFEPRSWRSVFDTTLCDKACQWLATGRCFSPVSLFGQCDIFCYSFLFYHFTLNKQIAIYHLHLNFHNYFQFLGSDDDILVKRQMLDMN
jgi:hypothetical protein